MNKTLIFSILVGFSACQTAPDQSLQNRITQLEQQLASQPQNQPEPPHLGSLMIGVQNYHAKLYYAGKSQNWKLAAYYVHELEETLEEIGKLHPEHDGIPIKNYLSTMIMPAVEGMEKAIEQKELLPFEQGFKTLTQSCNNCHSASQKEFIKIQTPTNEAFTNQNFKTN